MGTRAGVNEGQPAARRVHVVVAVPAHNEESSVGRAVRSILAGADLLGGEATVRVVVACDACTDHTVVAVRALARTDPRVDLVVGRWLSAGAARRAAVRAGLSASSRDEVQTAATWIATTDADSVVPTDWLVHHVAAWSNGDHAIAGIVDVLLDDAGTP